MTKRVRYSSSIPRVLVRSQKSCALASAELAEEIADVARQLVPVDTGFLKSQISVEKRGLTEHQVIADTNYANFVEFGTRVSPAQPYLGPAADQANAEFGRRMAVTFKKQIGKANPYR